MRVCFLCPCHYSLAPANKHRAPLLNTKASGRAINAFQELSSAGLGAFGQVFTRSQALGREPSCGLAFDTLPYYYKRAHVRSKWECQVPSTKLHACNIDQKVAGVIELDCEYSIQDLLVYMQYVSN